MQNEDTSQLNQVKGQLKLPLALLISIKLNLKSGFKLRLISMTLNFQYSRPQAPYRTLIHSLPLKVLVLDGIALINNNNVKLFYYCIYKASVYEWRDVYNLASSINILAKPPKDNPQDKGKMQSVKVLVESNCISPNIPSKYVCINTPEDPLFSESDNNSNIPTVDFSQLTSSNPTEHSKAIQQLGHACRDWGFFMVPSLSFS